MADVVVEAEAAGLDEVWLGDEGPARDPVVTLAAAAPAHDAASGSGWP